MLECTLLLVCSLHWFGNFALKNGNINSVFHSDKISADNKCWSKFVIEMVLSFSMKI